MIFFKKPQALLYVVFCLIGVLNAFHPTILSGFAYMQAYPGDTQLNNYFLEHSFQFLFNKSYVGGLFSPAFFYPYKNVLTFSDNLFGSAPIYFILRAFFSAEFSYQLWMIVVCILCFVSFVVLMRHHKVSHVPSAIGAFLFAFGMPRIVQIGHQQLLPQFFTPLAFLFTWNFIKFPRNQSLAWSLIFIYCQILAGIYLGWFLIFTLIIFTAVVYILDLESRQRLIIYLKQNYKATLVIAATWLLLMLALLFPYIKAKETLGSPAYAQADNMLPRLASWFLPAPNSLWWSVLVERFPKNYTHLPMSHEHHLFLGFLVIVLTTLSIYTLLRKEILNYEKSLLIKACLLVAISIFIITLRLPNGWSIWRIIYDFVPGSSVIRAVSRIWTMFYFYILFAVTLSLDYVVYRMSSKQLRIIALSLLCIGCVVEQIVISSPSFDKTKYIKEATQIQELMEKNCDVAYVTLPAKEPFWASQVTAMWAGMKANVPVVNGYSGNVPPKYGDNTHSMNTYKVINWLGEGRKGRLCIISQPSIDKDKLIPINSVEENTSSLGSWASYQIKLPLAKTFSQEIKAYEIPKNLKQGLSIKAPIIIKNTSNFLWVTEGKNSTNFSYRWLDSKGKLVVFDGDGDRTPLPFDLSPSESAAINAVIKTPPQPGKYSLVLTMVQEFVAWFSDQKAQSPRFDMTITSDS